MSSKLSIRYSGKLIKLPITPSTPMHEVLRTACQAHAAGDVSRFELQHGPAKRAVDLSLPFRLTGISNNATVTLAASSAANRGGAGGGGATVRVALQVAGEARREHRFRPAVTLADILDHFTMVIDRLPLPKSRRSP